ncbi:MAG TPA: hypothetical protein VHR15_07135 [Ktedonobacterales bacterium]|nr:hypothetical protein [Ktedonobacterales bacterium]
MKRFIGSTSSAEAISGVAPQSAEQEDHDAAHQEPFAPELIGELANDRNHRRRGQQVRDAGPGVTVEAMQVSGDGGQRGIDDSAIQRGEKQREHEACQHAAERPAT